MSEAKEYIKDKYERNKQAASDPNVPISVAAKQAWNEAASDWASIKAVFATFLSVFQIIPAALFVKITKSPETIVVSGLLTMVRGTGLELTRHHISLYYPVSKSTANKTSVEVVHVRQC